MCTLKNTAAQTKMWMCTHVPCDWEFRVGLRHASNCKGGKRGARGHIPNSARYQTHQCHGVCAQPREPRAYATVLSCTPRQRQQTSAMMTCDSSEPTRVRSAAVHGPRLTFCSVSAPALLPAPAPDLQMSARAPVLFESERVSPQGGKTKQYTRTQLPCNLPAMLSILFHTHKLTAQPTQPLLMPHIHATSNMNTGNMSATS